MEPKNREQREYLEALCDAKIKTVVCTGVAGTGKTVLAAVEALRWLNASLRSPREDDEEWCILLTRPRASDEDLDDLARPMTDAIKKWTTPAHEWRRLLEKDKHGHRLIQRTPFTKLLRGVTLDNTFVILDEVRKWRARISRPIRLRTHAVRAVYPSSSCAHSSPLPAPFCRVYPASAQNATYHDVKLCVTRMGDSSKMVIIFDPEQCDRTRGNLRLTATQCASSSTHTASAMTPEDHSDRGGAWW